MSLENTHSIDHKSSVLIFQLLFGYEEKIDVISVILKKNMYMLIHFSKSVLYKAIYIPSEFCFCICSSDKVHNNHLVD